eukprot:132126-Prorocentrum_minimum.AAC.1
MDIAAFARDYVKQREQLKQLVTGMVAPKMTGPKVLTGPELARMIEDTVEALNQGEIPMAGSVVDMFNRDILQRCVDVYSARMAAVVLPVAEEELRAAHKAALGEATQRFEKEKWGRREFKTSAYEKEYKVRNRPPISVPTQSGVPADARGSGGRG